MLAHPSPADLQDDKNEVVVFEKAVKPHDVGMVETFVNGDFGSHLLPLVLLQDQRLWHNLPGKRLLRLQVGDFVAFSETTFPQEPSPCVSSHGAWIYQNVWDFFERSRFRVDMCRRVRRLRNACTHFRLKRHSALIETTGKKNPQCFLLKILMVETTANSLDADVSLAAS